MHFGPSSSMRRPGLLSEIAEINLSALLALIWKQTAHYGNTRQKRNRKIVFITARVHTEYEYEVHCLTQTLLLNSTYVSSAPGLVNRGAPQARTPSRLRAKYGTIASEIMPRLVKERREERVVTSWTSQCCPCFKGRARGPLVRRKTAWAEVKGKIAFFV